MGVFIVYSLEKKYQQLSKSEKLRQTALAAVQLLNSFTFVETNQKWSFLDFSHHWTKLHFTLSRNTMNNGEDLRDISQSLLTSNWEALSRMLPSEILAGQIKS